MWSKINIKMKSLDGVDYGEMIPNNWSIGAIN